MIRNNSPIPVVGPITVTAQAIGGAAALVGRADVTIKLAPGATQIVDFPSTKHVDFTQTQMLLVTDSINDAVPANDVFPR